MSRQVSFAAQLLLSCGTGSVNHSPQAATDRAWSLWQPALSDTTLQKVHHCLVFLNTA